MKRKKYTVTEWLGILCIFSVFLDKAIRGIGLPFDFYYYYPVFILFLISMLVQKGRWANPPLWFIGGVSVVFAGSLIVTYSNGLLGMEFIKQVFGIIFSSFVYYNVLYVFGFNTQKIFSIYLTLAFWVALHGVIDNILHIGGIHLTRYFPVGTLQVREAGIMGEPFYLALALTPAVVYYIVYFKQTWQKKKFIFLTILLCYLITYSSTAVIGLVLGIFMSLYINDFFSVRKNKIILAPFLIVPVVLLVNFLIDNVDLISLRFNDTTSLFLSSEFDAEAAGEANSSTFALYSNYIIARDAFFENPVLGSGLGSHPLIYEETFLRFFPEEYITKYGTQNQQDANSKFLRLMSETGLIGLILFFWALIKFFAPKKKMSIPFLKELGAINYSIFVYIVLCLIRNGNYINIGFFLLFFLYYYTYKQIERGYKLQKA